jgi:hypothetical protein
VKQPETRVVVVVELVVVLDVVVVAAGASDVALNSVAEFTMGVENVAPQQVPSEVLNCATTLGFFCRGSPLGNDGFPLVALTWTCAMSGTVAALSVTPVIPSGAPVVLL